MPKPAKRSHGTVGAAVRQHVGETGSRGTLVVLVPLKNNSFTLWSLHCRADTDSKCSFHLNLQRKCVTITMLHSIKDYERKYHQLLIKIFVCYLFIPRTMKREHGNLSGILNSDYISTVTLLLIRLKTVII